MSWFRFFKLNSGYQEIADDALHEQCLRVGPDLSYTIYGYNKINRNVFLFNIISIIFIGIPYLIFYWFPNYEVIKYKRTSLRNASIILVCENSNKYTVTNVVKADFNIPSRGNIELRYFVYCHTRYVWIESNESFGTMYDLFPKNSLNSIIDHSHGLLEVEEEQLLNIFGLNSIEIKVKSYWQLFIEEVFHPYYLFQIFSMVLWCFDNYTFYAGCIFILTSLSAVSELLETRKQSQALHDLVESSAVSNCKIQRRTFLGQTYVVNSKNLVPGDLLVIPKTGCIMPCDAVLIQGTCIVNESMLTGESVPVMKTPPHQSDEIYNSLKHKRYTLFSGTHVIQARYYGDENVIAHVVKTGFDTAKGSLLKSIMHPSPVSSQLHSMRFVLFLFSIATLGMGYSLYLYITRQAPIKDTIVRTLDIVTIVVPPALPAAITVAIMYSQNRLKKLGIFCISPPRINICGRINLACFDKTGTLTKDGFDLYSVIPAETGLFSEEVFDPRQLDNISLLVQAMATCHALTRINKELTGDPLDLNMFQSIDWELEEPSSQEDTNYDVLVSTIVKPKHDAFMGDIGAGDTEMTYQIGILRVFQFSSEFQCMSVICKVLDTPNMVTFVKGAPEKIVKLCQPNSVPLDFYTRLSRYTTSGKRVIAVAYKKLPSTMTWKDSQRITRDKIESDLIFLGLIVMQNNLKDETSPVLLRLRNANIRTLMITGDNLETAVSVARNCNMILSHEDIILIKVDEINGQPKLVWENMNSNNRQSNIISFDNDHYHYALDGNTWSKLCDNYPDLLPLLLIRATVFARFQPDQKTQAVTLLQSLDYIVCMVGDGANDCGALTAAHVGVSLSETEASVAAPFTSSIDNISCVIHLILEGRCALVTSFAEIRYMAMYSMIQFFSVLLLYKRFSILGDTQFLFIDLLVIMTFALAIGRQGPSKQIVVKRPLGSLMSLLNLIPLLLQMTTCALIQIAVLYYLTVQPWYVPIEPEEKEVIKSWDNTVLFIVSSFQYIIMAVLYSKGKPYREARITNLYLMMSVVLFSSAVLYMCLCPAKWIANFLEILPISDGKPQRMFRYSLLLFPLVNFICCIFIESTISERRWFKSLVYFITCKRKSESKYKLLHRTNDLLSVLR